MSQMIKESKNLDKTKSKPNNQDNSDKSNGFVVLPYINGLTERLQQVLKKHKVDTAVKPHRTLRQLLVHPKDKREITKTGNCIIGCQNCDHSYVGETSRMFGVRLAEHQVEVKKVSEKKYTRFERRASEQEQYQVRDIRSRSEGKSCHRL